VRPVVRDLLINGLAGSALLPRRFRAPLLRRLGLDVGRGCAIQPGSWFGGTRIRIGDSAFINYGCFFDNTAPITLGANVVVAMQVLFCTSTHELGPPGRRAGRVVGQPIEVGDGCWIGAGARILPGVTIETGSVVAAGAVVTKDVPANTLVAGVPARPVRSLVEADLPA
jgi:maltose O-acetyltransferase